jgi:hypothetical protein
MTKPTVLDALPLANAIYQTHAVGCCLHVVLDDGNVQDAHVAFCQDEAQARGHAHCLALAEMLLTMSKTQRLKLGRLVDRG